MPLFPRCEDTNPKEKEMFSKVLHQGTGKEGHHLTHTVKKKIRMNQNVSIKSKQAYNSSVNVKSQCNRWKAVRLRQDVKWRDPLLRMSGGKEFLRL